MIGLRPLPPERGYLAWVLPHRLFRGESCCPGAHCSENRPNLLLERQIGLSDPYVAWQLQKTLIRHHDVTERDWRSEQMPPQMACLA
jgi:hypothetical protein